MPTCSRVNPYASTAGLLQYDRRRHAEEVAALVRASVADLGAVLDPSGDQLTLVDDEGHILSDTESLFCFLDLVADRLVGDTVALPVNAPWAAAELVESRGHKVRWSKTSAPSLMQEADAPGVGFAANLEGGIILPGFMAAFDAAAGLLKMLDLLAARSTRLSEVSAAAPTVHLLHETVVTPWEQKGMVMRSLVEQTQGRDVLLIDGVKVNHDQRLGARAAGSGGARDPHLGRGRQRRRGQAVRAGVPAPHPSDGSLTGSGAPGGEVLVRAPSAAIGAGSVAAMNVPAELRYSSEHEWVRIEGELVRVGITDYAQDALGDVVFVQLPEPGATLSAGAGMGEIESTKSVSEVYAPLAGTVVGGEPRSGGLPRARQRRPLRRGMDRRAGDLRRDR